MINVINNNKILRSTVRRGRPPRTSLEKALFLELSRLTGWTPQRLFEPIKASFDPKYDYARYFQLRWPAKQTLKEWSTELRMPQRRRVAQAVLRIHIIGISTLGNDGEVKFGEAAIAYEPRFGALFLRAEETFDPAIDKDALPKFIAKTLQNLSPHIGDSIKSVVFTKPESRDSSMEKIPEWYLANEPEQWRGMFRFRRTKVLKVKQDQPSQNYCSLNLRSFLGRTPWSALPVLRLMLSLYNTTGSDSPLTRMKRAHRRINKVVGHFELNRKEGPAKHKLWFSELLPEN